MADHVSVSIVGSLASAEILNARDFQIAQFAEAKVVNAFAMNLQDAPAGGPCTIRFATAVAGGGAFFDVTFADGTVGPELGNPGLAVPAGPLFARVTAASGFPQNLYGTLEISPAVQPAPGAGMLCSLASVKASEKITTTAFDTELTLLIQAVTAHFEREAQRPLVQVAVTGEFHAGGWDAIVSSYPIVSVTEIRENGAIVPSASYRLEGGPIDGRRLVRRLNGSDEPVAWAAGKSSVAIDYLTGFSPVPPDLAHWCCAQTVFEWRQTKQEGSNRVGLRQQVLDAGGTSEFLEPELLPGAKALLRRLRVDF